MYNEVSSVATGWIVKVLTEIGKTRGGWGKMRNSFQDME